MKKTSKPVELSDEQVENVNGGFKIVLLETPKFLTSFFRLIFKTKKKSSSK